MKFLFTFLILVSSLNSLNAQSRTLFCEQIQFNPTEVVMKAVQHSRYPGKTLYEFQIKLNCGTKSRATHFPTELIESKLMQDFFTKNGMKIIGSIVTKNQTHGATYLFNLRQAIGNGAVVVDSRVQLTFDRDYPTLINTSEASTIPMTNANSPFNGLRGLKWKHHCEQESSGWCYAWESSFTLLWEPRSEEDLNLVKNKVIATIMPELFKETFKKYLQFVADVAH